LGQRSGALVVSVEENSPAEKAGLYMGDTVVALNDHRIEDMESLLSALGSAAVGEAANLKIVRAGQVHDLSVVIGERN
jgi:S1-C subfamily serine protease